MNRRACVIVSVVVALLVVVGVVVALYFTVIKDDDDDDDGHGNATTEAPKYAMVVNGQWADWLPWSDCSATCGNGTQQRSRPCSDPAPENGGVDCVGISQETRDCAAWECPDCSRTCPADGTLSTDCSICECPGDSVSGRVTDLNTQRPLTDVNVYVVGHQWEPLTTTNHKGEFNFFNVCTDALELVVEKAGYLAESERYPADGAAINMKKLDKPVFVVHPQSVSVFTGDAILLHCEATSDPRPNFYEWFKDGNVIDYAATDGKTEVLSINNVGIRDQGEYKCRATALGGKKFSKVAKVIVQASGDDTCNPTPRKKMVALPPSCSLEDNGEMMTSVDIGTCGSDSCSLKNANNLVAKMCCGPTKTEILLSQCNGFEYSLLKVEQCGCVECQVDEITIEVTLVDATTGQPILNYLELSINGESSYSNSGTFTWIGSPAATDVVTIKYDSFYDNYLSSVSSIHLIPGVLFYTHVMRLTLKPTAVEFEADEEITMDFDAAKVTIPAGSVIDQYGNPVSGKVQVYATFNDPRVEGSFETAPGEFTFENEEGEMRQLQTFGVVGLQLESNFNKAYIAGKASFDINMDSLNIPENEDGDPDALLWTLDPVTGGWVESGSLAKDSNGKRKRQASGQSVDGTSEFPPDIPYINIDKPLLQGRQCYVSVFIYVDANMTEGLAGQGVTIYTKDLANTMYLGRSHASTDSSGKVCLPLPCGLRHELVPYDGYAPLASLTHHLPVGFSFTNTHDDSRVAFVSPLIDDISDGSGPVHRYSFNTCPSSDPEDHHFQFYLSNFPKPGQLDAVELRPNKTLSWYNSPANSSSRMACMIRVKILADGPSEVQMIGQSYFQDANGDLFGTYTTGLHRPKGDEYGEIQVDSTPPGNYYGCVEVRCPGDIYDEDSETLHEDVHTHVKVNIASINASQCYLSKVNNGSDHNWNGGLFVNFIDTTNSSLTLDVQSDGLNHCPDRYGGSGSSGASSFYYDNGFYKACGSYNSARRQVLNQCLSIYNYNYYYYSQGSVATFDCAEGRYEDYEFGWFGKNSV